MSAFLCGFLPFNGMLKPGDLFVECSVITKDRALVESFTLVQRIHKELLELLVPQMTLCFLQASHFPRGSGSTIVRETSNVHNHHFNRNHIEKGNNRIEIIFVYHRQQAKSNSGRQTSRGSNSCDTQHTPCPARDLPNPLSGLDPSLPSMLDTDAKRTAAATSKAGQRPP